MLRQEHGSRGGPTDGPDIGQTETVLYVLDTPTVVCIAFAAFVIGALLTGALWFIYSNTGSYAPASPLLPGGAPSAPPRGGSDPP
ncbi:unnamed protein product [Boreogadus saida]